MNGTQQRGIGSGFFIFGSFHADETKERFAIGGIEVGCFDGADGTARRDGNGRKPKGRNTMAVGSQTERTA